jgi:hypothetical protein
MTMIVSGSDGLEFPDGSDQGTAFTGNAATITSGTIATARLATGTANSSTYLRGDQTWATIAGSQWVTSGSNISYTTGSVGIGTSSPSSKLEVIGPSASVGTISWQNGSRKTGYLYSDTAGVAIYATDLDNAGIYLVDDGRIAFFVNGFERMRIDSSGNVGIGTDATTTYRTTIGNAGGNQLRLYALDVAASTTNTIDFWYLDGGGSPYNNTSIRSLSTANAGNGNLAFYTTPNSGSLTERGRFTSGGDFQFNSGYGSVATAYGCRAWVNFNGTGTVAIRASGNVSSIGDNSTGDYTINFTNAMSDANYSAAICNEAGSSCTFNFKSSGTGSAPTVYTTSACRIVTQNTDSNTVSFMVFR